MTTPNQVILDVIDLLERPDFEELGIQSFRNAIHICHGLDHFKRDLVLTDVELQSQLNNQGVFAIDLNNLPSTVRRIIDIRTLDVYCNFVDLNFKEVIGGNLQVKDYWGFVHRQTYKILGKFLNVWGVSQNATQIQLEYLSYPEVVITDNLVTCDSWILRVQPDLIKTSLALLLAKQTQQSDLINSIQQDFGMQARLLIQNFAQEIISPIH